MRLNDVQTRQFEDAGYVFLADAFHATEVALLCREARAVYALDRREVGAGEGRQDGAHGVRRPHLQ